MDKKIELVLLYLGAIAFVVWAFYVIISGANKCYRACDQAEEFIKNANSDNETDAKRGYEMIQQAHKFAFEKNTFSRVREVYNFWKGKHQIIIDKYGKK